MTAIYINRYGDEIKFSEINKNEIHLSGFNSEYMRYSFNINEGEKIINMIDPSGGPYIHVGANLKYYFEDKKDRIVESITIDINKIIFKIKDL